MALSEEEKQRIHEEERERAKAQKKYNKKRTSFTTWGCLTFILIFVIGVAASSCNDGSKNITSPTKQKYAGDTHIDFKEYINKPAAFYIEKLGEPVGGENYQELPTYTNWMWSDSDYDLNISFPQGDINKFVDIQFKDGICDQNSAYYLNKVGLDYPDREPDVKNVGSMYRWEPYGEYERLNVYCNNTGTRVVLISKVE